MFRTLFMMFVRPPVNRRYDVKSPRFAPVMIAAFALMFLAACQSAPPATTTAAVNDNAERQKETYRRLLEVGFNQGDTTIVDSVLVDNPIDHMAMPPGMPAGRAGLKQMIVAFRTGFPDMKITVESILSEGDRIAAYTVMTGTHTGEFMGMKPTGKAIRVEGFDLVRFEGDRMAEHWGVNDDAGMMRQLGVSGSPGSPL